MALGPDSRFNLNGGVARSGAEAVSYDVGLRQYMLQVYNYMASGLALTGIIAAAAGTLVAWGVVVFLMEMGWTFLPGVAAATVAGAVIVTVALGFAGTWRALGQKAAPHLRNR